MKAIKKCAKNVINGTYILKDLKYFSVEQL